MGTLTKLGILLVTLVYSVAAFTETEADHTVRVRRGRLKGMRVELPKDLPPVVVYRGLSYASLNGGGMRFMPPTSNSQRWDAIRLARDFGPVCPQRALDEERLGTRMPKVKIEHLKRVAAFTENQDEDCLNLNLYVPQQGLGATESPPYAVVVLIHGDSYEFGTGNAYDGSLLASYGQVIVVTLNYRLGALGFFSTGDDHAPGNYALNDITAALQWLKANVDSFGGDPSRVTLLGQGTGAALINILSSDKLFKEARLVKRMILQSGSALAPWAVCKEPLKWAKKLAEDLDCSWDRHERDLHKMVRCVMDKPAQEVANADVHADNEYFCAFGPVVDAKNVIQRRLLPGDPELLLKRKEASFNHMEVMVGLTRDEGFDLLQQDQVDGITAKQREDIIQTYVNSLFKQRRQSIGYIVDFSYKDPENNDESIMRTNIMEMLGDGQFNIPMIKLANGHLPKNKTFFYVFGYPSRGPDYPDGGASVQGDDLMYLLGAPLADTDCVEPFRKGFGNGAMMISEAVMRYFSNFIKSGNPNKPMSMTSMVLSGSSTNRYENLLWEPYNVSTKSYMHLGMRPSMKHYYRRHTFGLWVDLIPKVSQDNTTSKRDVDSPAFLTLPPPTPPPPPSPRVSSFATGSPSVKPTYVTPTDRNVISGETGESKDDGHGPDDAMEETTRDPPISMSLSITIAVGCSLLFLNIIVFAAVYYQKDKLKFEKKLRDKEKERDRLEEERVARDSIANAKSEHETDSLLDEDDGRAPPTPQRNNSLPHSPLLNHVGQLPTPPPPATMSHLKSPASPEKLLSRTTDIGRYTPSPNFARELDNNRRSDSTDSGAMMHNGSDDAPVTMV